MTNNDIFKKLRVALQLRDDQIVEILELVDFRISKAEIGNFFRNEDHPKYMECGDQILRNFLNGLVLFLRGTKENPKNPMEVLQNNKTEVVKRDTDKVSTPNKKTNTVAAKKYTSKKFIKKDSEKIKVFESVKFKNGKK